MIIDCNMLMRPDIIGVTIMMCAGCLPHAFYTHDLTCRTKPPCLGQCLWQLRTWSLVTDCVLSNAGPATYCM